MHRPRTRASYTRASGFASPHSSIMCAHSATRNEVMSRRLGWSDGLIAALDEGLRTLHGAVAAARPSPASALAEPRLSAPERRASAALMRVNHAGEIAAQALYV